MKLSNFNAIARLAVDAMHETPPDIRFAAMCELIAASSIDDDYDDLCSDAFESSFDVQNHEMPAYVAEYERLEQLLK